MAIFNCKSCGGDLEITDNTTVVTCEYCGRQQTVPSADNEKKVNLFNRANRLRSKCEFDKAASVYESIVAEFPAESEAYWGLCLCKFGIEYVDDPATANKIPTCHRTSYESIFEDGNFDMACENADSLARQVYRSEAKEIDRLQKEILEIAKNEEPFDVFICYKETAPDGQRTKDSVLAQDIYDALTDKGYKVFFSRITLEDKLGQDYEPYIFSALNSAKVMLAIGTDYEYFNAVWVKNEWSRFLALMSKDKSKTLIPCYCDIDAYDMPQEFKHLQGQDMGKVGFIQDLVRGIGKIIPKDNQAAVSATPGAMAFSAPQTDPMIKRAYMCLEDGDWDGADMCCENVLNLAPENAQAYLIKLCIELELRKPFEIRKMEDPLNENNGNYQKVLKFGSAELKDELNSYIKYSKDNLIYNDLIDKLSTEDTALLKELSEKFKAISGHRDADKKSQECLDKISRIEFEKKDKIYVELTYRFEDFQDLDAVEILKEVRAGFKSISGHKDADHWAEKCTERITQLLIKRFEKSDDVGKLIKIREDFELILSHKDADYWVEKCTEKIYLQAKHGFDLDNIDILENALQGFKTISGYKDSNALAMQCKKKIDNLGIYQSALKDEERGTVLCLKSAIENYRKIEGWKDADERIAACSELIEKIKQEEEGQRAKEHRKKIKILKLTRISLALVIAAAIVLLTINVFIPQAKYNKADSYLKNGDYDQAILLFRNMNYKDSSKRVYEAEEMAKNDVKYTEAESLYYNGNYEQAFFLFNEIGSYKDSAEKAKECWTLISRKYINYSRQTIEAGYWDTVGVKSNGTAVAVGMRSYNVLQWEDIVAVAAGRNHAVGLKSNGTVVVAAGTYSTQYNVYGWNDIVAVAAGDDHIVGLKSDGTVVAVGDNNSGQCDVSKWAGIVSVAAGSEYTVALKYDGTVVTTGSNDVGQCNVSNWTDIVAISASDCHTVGLKSDGTVVAVGRDIYGQCDVSQWKDIVSIAAGYEHTVGIKSDRTVVAVGWNYQGMCNVTNWKDIVAVAVGYNHTVGVKIDGTVIAIGDNHYGQCDVSVWNDIKLPPSLTN